MQIQLITKLIAQIKCGDITGTSVSSKAATQDQTQAVNKPFISTWNWKGTHPNDLSANVYHLSFFCDILSDRSLTKLAFVCNLTDRTIKLQKPAKKKTEEKSLKLSLFLQRFNINLKYQFNSVNTVISSLKTNQTLPFYFHSAQLSLRGHIGTETGSPVEPNRCTPKHLLSEGSIRRKRRWVRMTSWLQTLPLCHVSSAKLPGKVCSVGNVQSAASTDQ